MGISVATYLRLCISRVFFMSSYLKDSLAQYTILNFMPACLILWNLYSIIISHTQYYLKKSDIGLILISLMLPSIVPLIKFYDFIFLICILKFLYCMFRCSFSLPSFFGTLPELFLISEISSFSIQKIYIPTIQMFSSLYLCLSQFGGFLFHLNSIV